MRPIHLVRLEKVRPALILTRSSARFARGQVTVAPITSTVHRVATEVPVGPAHGLEHSSVIQCDNVQTVEVDQIGRLVGFLWDADEPSLAQALIHAFDLHVEELP